MRLPALAALAAAAFGLTAPLYAQSPGSVPPPPVREVVDENGVDVARGLFEVAQTAVSIGPAYPHGLSYSLLNFNQGWQSAVE